MLVIFSIIGMLLAGISSYFVEKKCCKHNVNILVVLGVSLITGILFGCSYYFYGICYEMFVVMIISYLTILIIESDFLYYIILDIPLIFCGLLIFILKWCYFGYIDAFKALFCGVLTFLFLFIIKFIGDRYFKRESLGFGDVKLAFFMGLVLNIRLGLVALVGGAFLACPYAIYSLVKNKEREIPFGPFLAISLCLVFVFMEKINFFVNILFSF